MSVVEVVLVTVVLAGVLTKVVETATVLDPCQHGGVLQRRGGVEGVVGMVLTWLRYLFLLLL